MAKNKRRKKSPQTAGTSAIPESARSPFFATDGKSLLLTLVLIAAALFIYWPALGGSWLWDDGELVRDNIDLRSLGGLGRIWFGMPTTDYWPLTWSALWIEYHLWGSTFLGYHLCSLALHLTSALLIWRLLGRLGLKWGWLGALLFVVHPLAVESVAWIAEIKNTLSLPLLLLSIDAWLDADESRKNFGYLRSVLFYLAAVLAKTSVIMLPVVLLLYCWWKRGRITGAEIIRSLPFFAIAAVMSLSTIYFHNHAPEINDVTTRGIDSHIACVGLSGFFYLFKFLFPIGLLPVYSRWQIIPPSTLQLMATPLLMALLFGLWTQRKGWGRHLLLGFGFFFINLFPVLGLLDMTYMNITWVADHLVYLPMIGLIGLVVAGFDSIDARLTQSTRPYLIGATAILMTLLAWGSHAYAEIFTDSDTLWKYTLQRNPGAYPGYNDLGNSLMQKGRVAEALQQYQQAVNIRPTYGKAHCNLGVALFESGRIPEAIEQYKEAIKCNPRLSEAYNNLGNALLQGGKFPEAAEQFQAALRIDPHYAIAYNNLGNALLQEGKYQLAMEQYALAIKTNPSYPEAHNGMGVALEKTGQIPQAIREYQTALMINPGYAKARSNLARAEQGSTPQ